MLSLGTFITPITEAAVPLVHPNELAQAGDLRIHEVVAPQHGERLVADDLLGHQHGVAVAQGLLLPHVDEVGQLGDALHLGQLLLLVLAPQPVGQLEGVVEVVLDGPLALAGDDDDLLYARGHRLLDDVLDDRLVHYGEHFLRLSLGGREEAGAQPGRGDHRLSYSFQSLNLRVYMTRFGQEGAEVTSVCATRDSLSSLVPRSRASMSLRLPPSSGRNRPSPR